MIKTPILFGYNSIGVLFMQIKVFDCEHESDLEIEVNEFLSLIDDKDIIDIQYQCSMMYDERSQIYSYSCMIVFTDSEGVYLNRLKKGRYK